MRRFPRWSWLVAVTMAAAGCGGASSDGLPREAISGRVTLDGQPLPTGTITFVPIGFEGPPVGAPVEGGSYSISRREGPIPGAYRVSVYSRRLTGKSYPDPDDPTAMIQESFEGIPPKYNLKSDLKAEVAKGGDNRFNFDLTGEVKTPPPAPRGARGRR